jgi:hypothetical protein
MDWALRLGQRQSKNATPLLRVYFYIFLEKRRVLLPYTPSIGGTQRLRSGSIISIIIAQLPL